MGTDNTQKKNLKWVWIALAAVIAAGIIAWCIYCATQAKGISGIFKFSTSKVKLGTDVDGNVIAPTYSVIALLSGIFIIATLGYLLGSITIKGVSLGTAGVFLVAILYGYLCTLIPADLPIIGAFGIKNSSALMYNMYGSVVQNIGLVLFVAAVGFIAGPSFFRNFKKNAKSYVVLGLIIILSGAVLSVLFAIIPGIGSDFSAGILSGALTSTPGFSAAQEAARSSGGSVDLVTLGYAIAYPFGVIGVVLFVQLMPKFLKADMEKERALLKVGMGEKVERKEGLFRCDSFGLMPFSLAVVLGLILGSINIPLTGKGYNGTCFSLGNTGGVLIMCLIMGHFGRIGKMSMEVNEKTSKVFREFGLMLFLMGAGVSGGVSLVSEISKSSLGAMLVLYGFLGGALMTLLPMVAGYFFARYVLKLPMLNILGSITGGMTSTPALGTLINVAGTDDVASAYASTYPVALVLVVLASQFIITLLPAAV
ncbi:MAG: permease [Clostridiales bacterium]|nr:permease [Clostridiales bacterium]